MEEKVLAKIKVEPEDFIVEEIGPKWKCSVEGFSPNQKPDFDPRGEEKNFLLCEMVKRDIDHFNAMKELSFHLKKNPRAIGYAGTKDRTALTSQRISIEKPEVGIIKNFSHERIKLKNFKWEKRKIKLGYLEANHFKIILRDIDKKDAIKISGKIRSLNWFPNYFGAQRFGSMRGNNVKIGKLILKRKFEEAIDEILFGNSEKERPEIQNARAKLKKEKDFREALNYFPRFLKLEYSLIRYLARNPQDFIGAIKNSERKNMLMFVNSVQSKIFNEILEESLERGINFTKEGQKNCILPGYKTRFYDGELGEIEQEVMKQNDLTLEDFDVREIAYLRIKGSFRKAIVEISDLNIEISDDEKFEGSKKIELEFTLPSGVYATTFLENFFELN